MRSRNPSTYSVVGLTDDKPQHADSSSSGLSPSRQRLRNDRVYTFVALLAFATFALSCGMLGAAASQRSHTEGLKGRGIMIGTLSRAMIALMEEAAFSVTFTNPAVSNPSGINGQTDRQIAMEMTRLQTATRDAFDDVVELRLKKCSSCASVLSMFDYPQLLNAQMAVMMRADTPNEVYQFYTGAQLRLMRVMAYYAGWGVQDGVSAAVWTGQLILAGRSMTFASGAWERAYTTQSFMQQVSYKLMAWAEANYQLVVPFASIMESHEDVVPRGIPPSMAALQKPVEPIMIALRNIMSSGTTSLQNLQSVGSVTPEEMVAEVVALYSNIVDQVDAENPWNKISESNWQWVILVAGLTMVISLAVVGLSLWEATGLIWAAGKELVQMKAAHRLESSLIRMHALVDSIYLLDGRGIEAATMVSAANSANAMGAERELLQLAGPAAQVLSYINPCILDRRLRPSVPAEYVPGSPEDVGLDWRGIHPEYIRSGLSLRPMSIAMVDLRCFAVGPLNADTWRSHPKDLFVFLNEMLSISAQCGGTVLGMSGTALIVAWNALTNGQQESEEEANSGASRGRRRTLAKGGVDSNGNAMSTENEACQMLVRFRFANLHRKYPKVRIAVVSGVCEQGVVGTASLRSYVVAGNFVRIGRMLLDMARLHNVPFVTDTATFLKLDTQLFRKRAIELVSLTDDVPSDDHGNNGGRRDGHEVSGGANRLLRRNSDACLMSLSSTGKTIAYEVTIAGTYASEYVTLWNAAFDDFFSGRAVESYANLVAWRDRFGKRQTWRRAAAVLCQIGGYNGATIAQTRSGTGFDYELFI